MSSKNLNLLLIVVFLFIVISPFFLKIGPSYAPRYIEKDQQAKTELESARKVSLMLTGDVMLGRTVMAESLKQNDPSYPFRKVSDRLKNADLVFVNLENPIIKDCPLHDTGFVFCAPPEMVEGLLLSGIDVVNLANNHTRNYGESGLSETIESLKNNGISATGLGELVIVERGGINFGFLGFDFTVNEPEPADYQLIRDSNDKADVLIVGVHWGVEYTREPRDFQRLWARDMVEAGADIIAGHHPHWVQTSQMINTKPVFYSLGNFIFDQMWSEETRRGLTVELTFKGTTLQDMQFLPIYMENPGQPEFVER